MIIFEPSRDAGRIFTRIMLSLSFGVLLCTLGTLLYEKFQSKIPVGKKIVDIGLIVLSGFTYPALLNFDTNMYITYGYFGVMTALFVCIFYASIHESVSKTFSFIQKNTAFNAFVCGVISAGVSICIFAFYSLIFSFNDIWKVYAVAMLFVWVVIFLNLSLSTIPGKETVLSIPKAYKVVVVYAALPVYLLLIAILYVYLGRILVTLNFPAGEINWLVSFASLMFIFFIFALEQYREENKAALLFVKYGGYFIIPLILMQFWAIGIRLSAYGLTSARYVSIVFNLAAITFAVVSLVKGGKWLKHMLLAVASISLLITVTPLNFIDVPVRNQTSLLVSVLERNSMLDGGRIVPNENISDADKIRITSAYEYIRRSHGARPDILGGTEYTFEEIFGFRQEFEGRRAPTVWGTFNYRHDGIDVVGYSRIFEIRQIGANAREGNFEIEIAGESFAYNISERINELFSRHGLSYDGIIEFYIGENKLILTTVRFRVEDGNIVVITNFEGFFLVR